MEHFFSWIVIVVVIIVVVVLGDVMNNDKCCSRKVSARGTLALFLWRTI